MSFFESRYRIGKKSKIGIGLGIVTVIIAILVLVLVFGVFKLHKTHCSETCINNQYCFKLNSTSKTAKCECKPGYVLWKTIAFSPTATKITFRTVTWTRTAMRQALPCRTRINSQDRTVVRDQEPARWVFAVA
jgi:hypothetical protein